MDLFAVQVPMKNKLYIYFKTVWFIDVYNVISRWPLFQGRIRCTPNNVPIVFIVFSRDSWINIQYGFPIGVRW